MYLEERRNGESNREYALRILKANIIQMILEPGCPIGEQKIAKELGMSRTPVREALVELMKTRICRRKVHMFLTWITIWLRKHVLCG